MATDAEEIRDILKTRLRATTQTISDANNYLVMNYVQKTLNYALELKVTTGTLSNSTDYNISNATVTVSTDCIKVLAMYEAASCRTVMRIPWQEFWHYDRNWLWQTGSTAYTRMEVWAPIGKNLIAYYPGTTATVNVVYLQDTTTIDSSNDAFYVSSRSMDLVCDLCEIIWHVHLRNFPEVAAKLEVFEKDIALYPT